ncbi:phenylalanine--tRNA ligase, beta subunit, partial [Vibrio cholerae HC-59B1]
DISAAVEAIVQAVSAQFGAALRD